MQQPTFGFVVAIANQQARWIIARIKRHPMGRVELLESVAFFPEMHQVLSRFVEFEDVVAGVTV